MFFFFNYYLLLTVHAFPVSAHASSLVSLDVSVCILFMTILDW
ncbi:hypothetical protein GLYMA_14G084150v4 [Glycine max]|nr:hypothetical protein GLYMA_14G084150v4 [Glycine max]KAH1093669.1 hypothetical protein GYH30_039412 [Glycine max]